MKGTQAKVYLAHNGNAGREGGGRRRLLVGFLAAVLAFVAAVLLIAAAPAIGLTGTMAHGDVIEGGPDDPAIGDEFAVELPHPAILPPITVTLSDKASGKTYKMQAAAGSIDLPTPETCGFTAAPGAKFVGWSTDSSGGGGVYAAGQMFPDNASHTALLTQDTTVYAIWLPAGAAPETENAAFYIRLDGTIPFEPSGHSGANYAPGGSSATLTGSVNWPIAVTNNFPIVMANLKTVPSDDDIAAAMNEAGKSFDPDTQEVVWYVIKPRAGGVANKWNVDGIVIDKASYLVVYEPNGGDSNVPAARSHMKGSSVAVDVTVRPQRYGYDFLGWSEDANATAPTYSAEKGGSFTMPSHQVTLYAVWRQSVVPVTYVPDPANYGTVSITSNSVVALTAEGLTGSVAKAKSGKIFQGWYQGDTLVTKDADLTATLARDNVLSERNVVLPTTFVARFTAAAPAISLQKEITNAPANGEYFTPGETITFTLKVINSGNTDLKNVVISDTLATIDPIGVLGVGEERVVSYDYTVTDDDASIGFVRNVAVASGVCANQATKSVKSDPASVAASVMAAPADVSYVVYGAYPEAGGSVDIPYETMDPATAEGLSSVTAAARDGYEFQGWYRHDGEFVSSDPTLEPSVIKDALISEAQRTPYSPTLFLAYFTPKAEEPENPDTPDNPDNPDNPNNPNNPDKPGAGTETEGGEGGSGNGGDTDHSTVSEKPVYHTMAKDHPSTAGSMPRTSDDLGTALWTVLGLMAAAGALALTAHHFRKYSK